MPDLASPEVHWWLLWQDWLQCSQSSSLLQIDDQRRTHNYDEFICTFISMLAQEGEGMRCYLNWNALLRVVSFSSPPLASPEA